MFKWARVGEGARGKDIMLQGTHPLLSGELLWHPHAMGHSDSVAVADAHFPAAALARRTVVLPGTTCVEVLAAIRTVVPSTTARLSTS